ncbi:hypothetical protein KRX19_10050 [Cardiobacteriaceae bacterium TAE3-ERU3]|nr:hypothetical protein [Cardiobacteriaceae bacterium TAE3-ERU3]
MKRQTIRNIHVGAAVLATLGIATFWLSTITAELFMSHDSIATVKMLICCAMFIFIPTMAITGATGMKMGAKSPHPNIVRKRKRMPIIALNGLLVLLPCAIYLNHLASAGQFTTTFYVVQIIEIIAGATNLTMMILSMRDGITLHRRPKKRKPAMA